MGGNKRDKTTGLPIPNPVVPATSICLKIEVPNALEYRTALKGVLSELGKAWNWSQTVGEDNQDAYTAAELWRERIENAVYLIDCEADMTCDDISICINENSGVRTAIQNVVGVTPIEGYTYPPGAPLTPSQMTARLNEIETCTFDAFWAQTEQYVDFLIQLGTDVFEQIESYSNALEAKENVPMGQFLGKLKNSSTAGKVIEFLEWALEAVQEAYVAADTTANRNAIKCALFCQGKDDCLITIQGTLDVLNDRLGGLLSPSDLEDLPSMINAFTAAAFNPALALDLWILFLMGSAKTAGMFGMQNIDETINMVLALAVNDANNDWELLCDECGDPPPDPNCLSFTATKNGWDILSGIGEWVSGQGFVAELASGNYYLYITRPPYSSPTAVTKVVVKYSAPVTNITLRTASATSPRKYEGLPVNDIEFSASTISGWTNMSTSNGFQIISFSNSGMVSTTRITEVCIYLA